MLGWVALLLAALAVVASTLALLGAHGRREKAYVAETPDEDPRDRPTADGESIPRSVDSDAPSTLDDAGDDTATVTLMFDDGDRFTRWSDLEEGEEITFFGTTVRVVEVDHADV